MRLIFSTPIDAGALRDNLRVEPPVANLRVATNDGEARIDAQLQAATLYTITIPTSLSDRAGVALGRDYQVRFLPHRLHHRSRCRKRMVALYGRSLIERLTC